MSGSGPPHPRFYGSRGQKARSGRSTVFLDRVPPSDIPSSSNHDRSGASGRLNDIPSSSIPSSSNQERSSFRNSETGRDVPESSKKLGKRTRRDDVDSRPARAPVSPNSEREFVRDLLQQYRECLSAFKRSGERNSVSQAFQAMKERYPHLLQGQIEQNPLPGVEVGDIFRSRMEVFMVGLHRHSQAGICSTKSGDGDGRTRAVSVVVSGSYQDDNDQGELLLYTGEGGHDRKKGLQIEDQSNLKGGNLALFHSSERKDIVRVIRGQPRKTGRRQLDYSYDGLYKVEAHWKKDAINSTFKVQKFVLIREPGQKPLQSSPIITAAGLQATSGPIP